MAGHGEKIRLGQMRESGIRGLLIYCRNHKCNHHVVISADHWADQVRLSDLDLQFVSSSSAARAASAGLRSGRTLSRR